MTDADYSSTDIESPRKTFSNRYTAFEKTRKRKHNWVDRHTIKDKRRLVLILCVIRQRQSRSRQSAVELLIQGRHWRHRVPLGGDPRKDFAHVDILDPRRIIDDIAAIPPSTPFSSADEPRLTIRGLADPPHVVPAAPLGSYMSGGWCSCAAWSVPPT